MPRNFGCGLCGASFPSTRDLQRHKERKFPCNPLIDDKLPEAEEQQREEKKYKCKMCERTFNKAPGMYRHMSKYCKLRSMPAVTRLQTRRVIHDMKEVAEKMKADWREELKKAIREELKAEEQGELKVTTRTEMKEKNDAHDGQDQRTKIGARKSVPGALRNAVWGVYIGPRIGESVCFCCGVEPISRSNYECGHVQSRAKGGQAKLDNMRPICTCCNKSMGTKNMFEFAEECGFTSCKIMPDNRQLKNQDDFLEMTDELFEELYPIER